MRLHGISKSLLLLLFCCIGWKSVAAQLAWEKTWGGPLDDGCELRNTRDGGFIAMASYGVASWILRLDANGDTSWTQRITQPFDLCAITETYDGGFLATGLTRTANRDLMAMKLGPHGDPIWTQIYVDSLHVEGMYTVLPCRDSTFLITGYTSANGYDMLALRIDSLGAPLWKQQYGGPYSEAGTMAAPTADGGFVLTTTASSTGNSYIWVVRIDGNGDTLWTRNHLSPHSTGGSVPTVAADGRILIMGWIARADYDNYLICLDANGNELWRRAYQGLGFESRTARGIIEDRLGGFTFASSVDHAYGPSGPDQDIALFRVDSLGNVFQTYRIGHAGDEMPRYFEQAGNGDYVVIGYSTSFLPVGQQTYIARLAPTACNDYFYDLGIPLRDTLCPSDSLLLDAGAGFAHYLWSDGDTNQVRLATVSDTFYVQSTDSQGCLHFSDAHIVQAVAGPVFSFTASGNFGIQFDGTLGSGNQVRWNFGDGDSAFVEDPMHVYAQAGTYWVCIETMTPACGASLYCDSVTVTGGVGLSSAVPFLASLCPNPASSEFRVVHSNRFPLRIEVFTSDGSCIREFSVDPNQEQRVPVTDWAAGLYWIRMEGGNGEFSLQKLVIAK